MVITVKKYKLSQEPKVGYKLKGGKSDGYVIRKIEKIKKWYGTIIYLYVENPEKHLKRILSYDADSKQISDFKKGELTAVKGQYYLSWN